MKKEHIFLETIKANTSSIMRICSVYSNQVYTKEDLFQEVLMNIWKSMDSYKNEAQISTWIYRIALNVCLAIQQKQKKKNSTALNHLVQITPQEEIDAKHQELVHCIKKLNESDRSVITLYLEELNYAAIGEILGIKENTVAVKMKRIKTKLLKCMKNEQ